MSSTTSSPSPSSSSPTSDTSFLHLHPVYPCVLPTPVTYTLYVAVITNAGILYELEKLPFYESDAISQELVCLLHDSLHLQSYYSSSVPVMIDYLSGTSFLLVHTTQCMLPLGLCQFLKDQYIFSLGPRCFSFMPFPQDAPTPVPLQLFAS